MMQQLNSMNSMLYYCIMTIESRPCNRTSLPHPNRPDPTRRPLPSEPCNKAQFPADPVPACGTSPNARILRLVREARAGGEVRFGCGERPEARGADLASGWFER